MRLRKINARCAYAGGYVNFLVCHGQCFPQKTNMLLRLFCLDEWCINQEDCKVGFYGKMNWDSRIDNDVGLHDFTLGVDQ